MVISHVQFGHFLKFLHTTVFWRSNRGNIHYVSGGIANNIFGGIFALILWFILQRYNNVDEVCVSMRFIIIIQNANVFISAYHLLSILYHIAV